VAFAAILALATIALALFRLYNSACSYDPHLELFGVAEDFGQKENIAEEMRGRDLPSSKNLAYGVIPTNPRRRQKRGESHHP